MQYKNNLKNEAMGFVKLSGSLEREATTE